MKTTTIPAHASMPRLNGWLGACILLTLLSSTCLATDEKTATDLAAYKEVSQTRLEATRDLLQKDVQALTNRLDTQDKRIDSQNAHIDQNLSVLNSGLTILGIALALAGLGGYFSVRRKAEQEATEVARTWFEEHTGKLEDKINNLQARLQEIEQQANTAITTINAHTQAVQEHANQAKESIQRQLSDSGKASTSLPPEAAEALLELARTLKAKPEANYTFQDWDGRAFAAYNAGDKEGAARYWREAAQSQDAQPTETAGALFNAGITLGELQRHEEVISIFDEVIRRYGEASESALRERVASALVNKSVALMNLGRSEESIAVIDEVIRRFGESSDATLQVRLARAKNAKGFDLLCRAKQRWQEEEYRQVTLRQADTLFFEALAGDTDNAIVLGNQAYCAHLLGQPEDEVREKLAYALSEGGYELYKATLGDLDIHPIPPDAAFRTLLDAVWQEVGTAAVLRAP